MRQKKYEEKERDQYRKKRKSERMKEKKKALPLRYDAKKRSQEEKVVMSD